MAGLSAGQAKQVMMRELEDELRHESARLIRQVEEETRRDADRRARSILAAVMQRVASSHAVETTVSVVELKSDELKGRIIGREGRNIRALETLTGIDFIIDDTPGAVLLSGFDGVRREIARLTLEKLLQDGRIHPARIEEAFHQAKSEIDQHVVEVGEQAVFEANVGSVHPELVKLLGKLRFRTSYGQNVLHHSIECARLASMLAGELGGDPRVAARAALLHDIGKAVSHETEGPHALVGGELARRYKESEAVAHAMEAHHNEVELQTVEAVIVQIVDALSGARPGARGESLEHYVKRLHELEAIASRHAGVDKVYAMHAGREIRVIVHPGGDRRRRGGAAVARDRARGREGARVPRPDQGDGDPGEPRDGLCAVMRRFIAWRGLDEWRAEACTVVRGERGLQAVGVQVGAGHRVDYGLETGSGALHAQAGAHARRREAGEREPAARARGGRRLDRERRAAAAWWTARSTATSPCRRSPTTCRPRGSAASPWIT